MTPDRDLYPIEEETLDILKDIKKGLGKELPAPKVTVNVPKADPPKIPEIKIPEIKVPKAEVTVQIPEIPKPEVKINIPKIPVPKIPKPTFNVPETKVDYSKLTKILLEEITPDTPLPVQIYGPAGKPIEIFSSSGGGGGGVIRDILTSSGASLISPDGKLKVEASNAGVQYTEGDTDASITGNAIMFEDAPDSLSAASVNNPFPVLLQETAGSLTVGIDGLIPGVASTDLGKAEDEHHTDGDTGVFMLGVRSDSGATLTNADGDYSPLAVTDKGAVHIYDGGNSITVDNTSGTFKVILWNGTTNIAVVADNATAVPASGTTDKLAVVNRNYLMFNGNSSWERMRQIENATNSNGTGIQAVGIVGQFDDSTPTAITENQFGNLRMSNNRNLYQTIRDAAGNERGVNVDASNRLLVKTPESPADTALNTYSTHLTTNATTTPVSSTAYVSSIAINTVTAGTTSTITIKDKQATALTLVNALPTGVASTTPTTINFETPIKMTSGIDIVTAGAAAATVDVWINYYA